MTRQKKSRKSGPIGVRKQDLRPKQEDKSPRKKKAPKGQKPGTRNAVDVLTNESASTNTSQVKRDKKVGSKKPIPLTVSETKVEQKPIPAKSNLKPAVTLEKVKAESLTPEQELQQLENDQLLIELAERVEQGELLTGKDAKYFNKHMDRYEELAEQLGIEDDEEDDSEMDFDANQWDDLIK